MEERMAHEEKIPFKGIYTGKLRRYFDWQNFIDPFRILLGFFQSIFLLKKYKPHIIFAKGGYVSVPVCFAAFLLRIPIIIHESDVVPGLANKILAKLAKKVCISFEKTKQYFPYGILTGSPVREELKPKDRVQEEEWSKKAYTITKFNPQIPTILVLGGSLGAQSLTQKIYEIFPAFEGKAQFILQTGKGKLDTSYNACPYLKQYEYIGDDLKYFYQIADIVISRAGANTISELALLGKAAILVPLGTQGSRGDQIVNAQMLEEKDAVFVKPDNENSQRLLRDITKLLRDPSYRRHLERNIEQFSPKGAGKAIAEIILETVH